MPFNTQQLGLIGIDTGHKLVETEIRNKATGSRLGTTPDDTSWSVWQNSGVAVVAPVWKIAEVLDEDELKQPRDGAV
jgi:hypothetical protein